MKQHFTLSFFLLPFFFFLFFLSENILAQQGTSCNNPLVYNGNNLFYSGTTCGAGDNVAIGGGPILQATCSNPFIGDEDIIILFTPSETTCYTIEIEGHIGASFAMYAICPNDIGVFQAGSCLGVSGAVGALGAANINIANTELIAGTSYFLVVSSYNGPLGNNPCGDFQISAFIPNAVGNDFCGGALPLVGTGSNYEATDCGEPDDWTPTDCANTWTSNENGVWYTFNNPTQQDVTLDVYDITCQGGGGTLQMGVWTNNNTCDLSAETSIGCLVTTGDASVELTNLPAGDYYLFVDGDAGADCTWNFGGTLICDANPPTPPAPLVLCTGDALPATLSVTPDNPANTIEWYASPNTTSGTPFATGATIPTPSAIDNNTASTYTLYVTETNVNGTEVCQSGPANVIIQISNTPASPVIIPPDPICIGDALPTLTASGAGNINWYIENPSTTNAQVAATGSTAPLTPAVVNNNAVGTYPFWATVQVPPDCESEPTQVNIVVQNGIVPTLQDTPLCQNATLDLNTIDDDNFTGTWTGPNVTGNIFDAAGLNGNVTLTFTPDGDCESPATAIVTITESQTPILTPATVCQGETINLTPLLDPLYTSGSWVGDGVSGNTFDATNMVAGPQTINFFSNEICVDEASVTITVTAGAMPTLTPANVCETETLDLTTIDDDAFTGTWTGNGVSGTTFNPNGLTGNQTLTFTPDGNCEIAATVTISLDASQTPSLTPTNVCETETLDLTTIDDDAFTGTWTGNGVSGTTFNPNGLTGNQTLTFTPNGNCTESATVTITLDASQTPTLTPTNICETETLDLNTIDDDSFTGTWTGNGVSGTTFDANGLTGNQTLTFTPDGNCQEAATVTISLDASQMPILTPTNICETETLNLTTIDDDNFAGTWSGNGVSGNTFDANGLTGNQTLTFTPFGNCEAAATVTITLDALQTPTLTPTNVCATQTLDLTTIDDDSFTGTWFGNGVLGTTFSPIGLTGNQTLTFTPDGDCTESATVTITLDASQTPTLTPTNVCETATLDLNTIDDDSFTGTWTGNGVSGTTFDANGLTGNQTLTFTPDGDCTESATVTITLDASQTPTLTPTNVCETATLDLNTIDDDSFTGTWTGNGVSGTTFDANGLTGNQTLTFTPDGDCTEAATVTISLDASQTPTLTPANVCETGTLDLTTIDDDSFTGTWTGNGVSGTTFDPNGLTGNQTLTFTPDGDCTEAATVTISLDASQTPTLTPANVCETGTLDLTTIDDDSFTGTWSGNGVSGTIFDANGLTGNQTLTFTPDGDCTEEATVTIALNAQPTADFTLPSEICADGTSTVSVVYTGSADVNTATFNWDFGGGTESSTGNETYDISFASAGTGTATISLTVIENGCESEPFTQNITLAEPLSPPLVNCSATISEVTFDWNDVANATDYEISITVNGSQTVSPTSTNGSTTYTESGLNQGDEVEITVVAIGGNACGDSPSATSSCIVQNCPDNPIDTGNVPTDFCDNETTFNFAAAPSGVTVSGDGVVANTFEPSLANLGINNINFNYIDADGCEYNTPLQITVNAVPTADFTVSPNEICNDGSSIITVTYTGTASPAATFNWNFNGGNETLVGTETYEVLWDTEGAYTISLTVTENNCDSDEVSENITVTPLPDASWQTQSICEADGTITLLADAATSGTWSGNGISDNGNGTADFNPSGLDGDIAITFTTGNAPCEQTLIQNITVTANPDASWTTQTICEQDGTITLSPDGTNGGTWSGNGISDNGNGTAEFNPSGLSGNIAITYTVGSASCEQFLTQNISVTPLADASWQTQSICEADGTITLSADAATSGTWSGNGISDNGNGTADFNPSGLDGDIAITFTTGDAPCEQTLTQNITVTANPDASWTTSSICEQDGTITLSPDGTNGGTWSGNGISDNGNGTAEFNPSGLSGNIAITYTVGSADCEQSQTQDITVIAEVDASWTASSVCQNEGIIILMPDGTPNGVWSGDGITNVGDGTAQFEPSGLSGNIAVTYNPSDSACPQSLTQDMTITPTPDASFTADTEVCADGNTTIQVVYTGSNDTNTSNFLWDFGGGIATQIGTENYEVSFNNTGNTTATISLIVSENGCESVLETETINLNNPLNAPQLICGTATTSTVSFDWNAVTGATDYELTVQINANAAGSPFSVNNATTYEETNLQEGDEVTLCITNISNNICSNETVCLTCEAQNCPANPIDIGNVLNTYCLDTQPIILNENPSGVTFSGDGVLGNTFDPVSSGITQSGTYTINYDYTNADGCAYSLSHDIFLNPIPTADFTATSEICNNATDFANINYTGNATTAAIYNWDFDGGNAVAVGNENYEVNWPNAGTYTIGLTVEENGCISELFTQNVSVVEPLALPILNCGTTTTNSVEFVWNDINGATEYELTIDDGNGVSAPFSNGLNTTYLAENLIVGQNVTITVVALGVAPCGNTESVSITCTAENCPTISPTIDGLNAEYCESEGTINITVSPIGGTLSGEGIVGNTFNTNGLDGTYTITYDYTDTASNCDYSISQDVTVFPIPTADFTVSDTEICADGTSEITVTYTGSAATSATFVWDFGDANATAQGNETYILTYANDSANGNISLTVTENNCVSAPFILSVNIFEPLETPNVSCIGSTTNSVTFSWAAIANANGYEITYNTPSLSNQTETLDIATTEYTVSGLNVNELADISVVALGDAPCGNSEAGTADCTAQNCPTISPTIDGLNAEYCESEGTINITVSPIGGTLSGEGIVGNTFNTNGLDGTYTITYDYTDTASNCDYSISQDVTVFPIPTADFTVSDTEICADGTSETTVTYTGSAATSATFVWDFGDANATAQGNETYILTYANGSTNGDISLTVTENNCISEPFILSVNIFEPLETPNVSCIGSTTNSVTFSWSAIANANGYEITYNTPSLSNQTETLDAATTEYTVSSLNVNELADISIVALGDVPCGNSEAGTADCTAQNCPTIEPEILDLLTEYCESEGTINITVSPIGGTLSGEGIVGDTFNTNGLDGTYTITYDYTDTASNCDYSVTQDVTVFPIPTADFTISDTEICADGTSETTVTYTGSAATSATFVWDFGDANATAQGNETYILTYANGSTNGDISLTVTENNCVSEPFILSINIFELQETPNVSCIGSTTNTVTFSWSAIANANGYEITYNTPSLSNQTEILDAATTEYTVSGLNVNELADISIVALGDAPCGNSEAGNADCTAQNCPTISPTIDGLNAEYCESEGTINITVSPTGGTLSGDGIIGNTFNTTGLDGTYTITYDYTDTASNCDYSVTQDVTVFPIPTADFTISDTEICADGTSETTVTYTGSAATSATFVWDFGDANATAQGNETYILTYANGSTNGDISLTVTENNCVSEPFILSINIFEPLETPFVTCTSSTLTSVTFEWNEIENATAYEVTIGGDVPALIDTITTTISEVVGLNEGETATISVVALGDLPCGNSEPATADCIAQNCPDITLTIDGLNEAFCETETAVALVGTPTGGTFTINGTENTQFDPLALGVGDFEVIYSYADENNCQYSVLQNVQVLPQPIADFSLSNETICVGESIDFSFVGTASTDAVFEWTFENGTPTTGSNSESETASWTTVGTHNISLTITAGNCSDSFSTSITVSEVSVNTIESTSLQLGSSIELTTNASAGSNTNISFEWQGGNIDGSTEQNPSVSPVETTTYTVLATDSLGCSASDNVTITVFASNVVLVPNAFSPNEDGQNDFFKPFAINAESMTLAIYNRWGQEVYSESGTNSLQGWDGIYKAKAAEVGVYVYYVTVTFADGEERFEKGNLTLIR